MIMTTKSESPTPTAKKCPSCANIPCVDTCESTAPAITHTVPDVKIGTVVAFVVSIIAAFLPSV